VSLLRSSIFINISKAPGLLKSIGKKLVLDIPYPVSIIADRQISMLMRKIILVWLFLSLLSCSNDNPGGHAVKEVDGLDTTSQATKIAATDSTGWIDSFRAFRDAVYQKDKEKVKQYIGFPILNENNEIWSLVGDETEKLPDINDPITPFTEKDYERYFAKLFPKQFVQALLKVKSAELAKKGEYETIEIKEKEVTYKMNASVDKESNTLQLILSSVADLRDENGEALDGGESSVGYYFDIISNKTIRFKGIRMAG